MKNCSYCGRENSDEALRCHECGTEFEKTPTTVIPQRGKTDKPRHIGFRLWVALCVGLVVAAIAIYAAWQNTRNASGLRLKQWVTERRLSELNSRIAEFQIQSNAPPHSLTELPPPTDYTRFEQDSAMVDGWGRPFEFSIDGTNWLVTSLGSDGKPGGRGLDYDLTDRSPEPKQALPTLPQFLFELPTGGIIMSCLVSGLAACLISFFMVKSPDLSARGLVLIGLKIGATIIGAITAASMMSVLHIPNGH